MNQIDDENAVLQIVLILLVAFVIMFNAFTSDDWVSCAHQTSNPFSFEACLFMGSTRF